MTRFLHLSGVHKRQYLIDAMVSPGSLFGRVDFHERSTVVSTQKRQGKSLVAESMYYLLQSAARLAVTASR